MSHTIEQVKMDPIFQALNPRGRHFLEARVLPSRLNPFVQEHIITVVALTMSGQFPHIKTIPALQMMLEDFLAGRYEGKHTIVVDSSGNTAHGVVQLARAFGLKTTVVMSMDTPRSKVGVLAALSPKKIILVGKGESVSEAAVEEGQRVDHIHLNQYTHTGNTHAHEKYTGPEVLHALGGGNVGVIAIAMGSGGTAAGVGAFFKKTHPDTIVVGVVPKLGQQVPGARDRRRMQEVVTLPWGDVVDVVVEVSRKEAFIATRQLWSAVEPQPGPTSGLAWRGLEYYLASLDNDGREKLRGKKAAFICPDGAGLYSDLVISELDTDQGLV